jgi:hypothetical protein
MLTLFAFLDFMSLRDQQEGEDDDSDKVRLPRHRAEPDYTLAYIVEFDERLDESEPRRVTLRQRLHALLFR